MRTAPALQVVVTRFDVWRTGVWLVGGAAALLSIAWAGWHGLTRGWAPASPLLAVGVVAAAVSLRAAAQLAASRAFDLRWDGRAWHFGRPAAPATDPIVGEVQVAVDLGSWLLLRFDSSWPLEGRRRYWLPVQRRGLETAWHGLRCAVYSPRPTGGLASQPGTAG